MRRSRTRPTTALLAMMVLVAVLAAPALSAAPHSKPHCRALLASAEVEQATGIAVYHVREDHNGTFEPGHGAGRPGEASTGTERFCGASYDIPHEDEFPVNGVSAAFLEAGFGETQRQWNALRAAYQHPDSGSEHFKPVRLGHSSNAFLVELTHLSAPDLGEIEYKLYARTRHGNALTLLLFHPEGVPGSASIEPEEKLAKVIMARLDQQATR
jgi:hypothetical protein